MQHLKNAIQMSDAISPIVTVAVPSFNQGQYLDCALTSIFQQNLPVEVFVMDGGSTDNSLEIIQKWEHRLSAWRSSPDGGQAAAINEGISLGKAPFVCWLNSDDWMEPGGLNKLLMALIQHPDAPVAYGKAWNIKEKNGIRIPVWTEPFSRRRLALRCIISQPATLIRRTAWEAVHGTDPNFHMAMDYELWWKIFNAFGEFVYVNDFIAVNRIHAAMKTNRYRQLHYQEAMMVVRKYNGTVPLKWWLFQPYAVWYKGLLNTMGN